MNAPLARIVQTHKAIAHPARLRLLAMLRSGPLCVCQMTAALNLAVSSVSEHLSELRKAGLVSERREGRWVEYRIEENGVKAIDPSIDDDAEVAADAVLLVELRRIPLDELCGANLDLSQIPGARLARAVERAARLRASGNPP